MATRQEMGRKQEVPQISMFFFRSGDKIEMRYSTIPEGANLYLIYHFHEGVTKVIERKVENPQVIKNVASRFNSIDETVENTPKMLPYEKEIKSVLTSWKAVELIDLIPAQTMSFHQEVYGLKRYVQGNVDEEMGYLIKTVRENKDQEVIHTLLKQPDELFIQMGISLASPPAFNGKFQNDFRDIVTCEDFSLELRERAYLFLSKANKKAVTCPKNYFGTRRRDWYDGTIYHPEASEKLRIIED